MVIVIVVLTILVFVAVDFILRTALKRREEAKLRLERQEALDTGLRLDYTDEAPSLERVEVDAPKARVLAVDDEPVVLDSFRKILVLEGFSVDTVETAQEGLGLVRKNNYDFVFTDLKMPGMDGLDLTKAVKHLRPDIDVVMITGYGTIETAVETMRHGAMDFIEKPFTADELGAFARKCLIRRQDRIERETAPRIQLVTAPGQELDSEHVINVPGGVFVSDEHIWVNVEVTGQAQVGLDGLAVKALRGIEQIELPEKGANTVKGEALFSIRRDGRTLEFPSPLTGRVVRVNHDLIYHLDLLGKRPLNLEWICCIEPEQLTVELGQLRIGADAVDWYEHEAVDLWSHLERPEAEEDRWELEWGAFEKAYLGSQESRGVHA